MQARWTFVVLSTLALMVVPALGASPKKDHSSAADPMVIRWPDKRSAAGLWQRVVDGKPVAWFLVYESNRGVFDATLVKTLAGYDGPKNCSNCPGSPKDTPILGLTVLRGLKQDGQKYTNGSLLDPRDGRTYQSAAKVSDDGRKLELRVVMLGAFGAGETWERLPDTAIKDIDKAVIGKFLPQAAPATDDVKALQPVFFATNRKVKNDGPLKLASITNDRSQSQDLQYGLTIVAVPKNHSIGRVERPHIDLVQSIIQMSLVYEKEADKDHFRLRSIVALDRAHLQEALKAGPDSVLVFVHGYNVSFQDAVFKAAQIAYDANFAGTVLVFSWPSAGQLLGYDHDRESALFSGEDLLKIFRLVSDEIGQKRVFVLAHSLGNEVLVHALQQAALTKSTLRISELMLAAPDVDKDVFMKKAADIKSVAKYMTLYASAADKALLASQKKAWGSRMGYVGSAGPTLIDGIETIDVTAVGSDMLGLDHGTFSERAVLEDIGHLIMSTDDGAHLPPDKRLTTLKFMPDRQNVKYWLFPK